MFACESVSVHLCVCVCASFSVALELWNFAEGPRVGGLAVGGKGPPLTIIKLV